MLVMPVTYAYQEATQDVVHSHGEVVCVLLAVGGPQQQHADQQQCRCAGWIECGLVENGVHGVEPREEEVTARTFQ